MDTRRQVQDIFQNYVFGFIKSDIEREIWLAKIAKDDEAHGRHLPGGGNLLAALGLCCYTEFLGSFITGKKGRGTSKANFVAFFRELGPGYASFAKTEDVYDTFRCGLAHEYAVKKDCTIAMLKGKEKCGVGKTTSDAYWFVVERYFEDLMAAAAVLYQDLLKNPKLPV
jgi:hypothetical protein